LGTRYLSNYYSSKQKRKEKSQKRHHHFISKEELKVRAIKLKDEDVSFLESIKNESETSEAKRLITPNRFSAGISLLIHLLAILFMAFIFIEGKSERESYVEVDFTRFKPAPRLRQMRLPRVAAIQRPDSNTMQKQQFTPTFGTMADIPTGNADFVLPVGNFASSMDIPEQTGVRELSERIRPVTKVVRPKTLPAQTVLIAPKRETVSQMESLTVQGEELTSASLGIPTVSLRSDVIEPPKFIHKVVPKYPELAKRVEKEGIVILEAEISTDGTACDIKVVEKLGYGCEEAAIEALKSSRFLPAKRGKKLVAVRIQIPYRFQFEE